MQPHNSLLKRLTVYLSAILKTLFENKVFDTIVSLYNVLFCCMNLKSLPAQCTGVLVVILSRCIDPSSQQTVDLSRLYAAYPLIITLCCRYELNDLPQVIWILTQPTTPNCMLGRSLTRIDGLLFNLQSKPVQVGHLSQGDPNPDINRDKPRQRVH